MAIKTPAYKDEDITRPVKVFMELFRPSDQAKSEPREFTYMPVKKLKPGSKRPRYENYSSSSYNSSSVASDELPAPLSSWNTADLSAELQTAMTYIDSDEFRRLFDQFGDTDEYPSMAVDAPRAVGLRQALPRPQGDFGHPVVLRQRPVIKLEVSETDRLAACRAYDELLSFSKTTHKPQVAVQILRHWLDTEEKTNALHVFVCQNNVEATGFILKLISLRGLFDLVNVKNAEGETPLHLAVKCQNEILVKYLLACRAKVGVVNGNMNTCLHTAVEENAPIKIVEMLLANRDHEKVTSYIDMDNREGNTALLAAVEHKNLSVIKLLCLSGADINKRNLKTGFAPLRVAIEKQHLDIIKYIMWVPKMDPMTEDFRNISPLRAAHNRECSKEILEVIERYMTEKNLEVDIKEEVEDDSDEEIDDESEIKLEMMSPQELEELYKNITTFTPQCLEEVASILNESGKWEDLADLLDLSHIIRCGIISRDSDVSKYLLRFAVETHNDTLWEIRSFLENLDEARAVEAMDRMVQNMQ
ncbi:hypothetical protein NQ318_017451 [Aromia moschata]|uniref:Rel homology dimerisation domain-containing protein n=1 Tax=Aromia moschata TaxID=1265417 RepID=A0AAV8Z419_9CUCU|nr:hypothetical protein NQ318_017451 [Aromia moschata]